MAFTSDDFVSVCFIFKVMLCGFMHSQGLSNQRSLLLRFHGTKWRHVVQYLEEWHCSIHVSWCSCSVLYKQNGGKGGGTNLNLQPQNLRTIVWEQWVGGVSIRGFCHAHSYASSAPSQWKMHIKWEGNFCLCYINAVRITWRRSTVNLNLFHC